MKTWTDIEKALNEELPPEVVEPPNQRSGIYGNWVRGHTIMELANSVFGADGWSSNIISPPKVEERVVAIGKEGGERHGLAVTCIVQITGHGLDGEGNEVTITKTDMGWGTAAESYDRQAGRYDPLKPQQIRPAVLGSITIGFKRCLSQFGRKLGMQLYIPDEDHMVMGWEEGEALATQRPATGQPTQQRPPAQRAQQPAPRQQQEPGPGEQAPPSAGDAAPASSTVATLAKAMGIEVTKDNERVLVDLAAKELKLAKAGKTVVRLKKVKEQLGAESSTVATVYAEMPSYGIWMASEVATKEKTSKPFQDMAAYDQLLRMTQDIRYMLQGGTYEPWPKADIHNPTIMVGYLIERAALNSMKQNLIERFPSDSGDDCNKYRLKNHLIGRFQADRVGMLTWEQLAAFRAHVMNGEDYPDRWGGSGEPKPVLTKEDVEADKAAVAAAMGLKPETTAETQEAMIGDTSPPLGDTTDYSGQCADLLMEIQSQIEYEGNLVVFADKKGNLSSANAHNVVKGIHAAVASGNLKDAKAVETLLTTALKGLAK